MTSTFSAHNFRTSQPRLPKQGDQAGFTFMELIVALAIIGAMAIAIGYSVMGRSDDAKANLAKIALASDMPQSIFSYFSMASIPGSGTDLTNDLAARGMKPTTPWNETWSATVSGSGPSALVQITYPVGAEDGDNLATLIAGDLDNEDLYPQIDSATANGSDIVVQYDTLSTQ